MISAENDSFINFTSAVYVTSLPYCLTVQCVPVDVSMVQCHIFFYVQKLGIGMSLNNPGLCVLLSPPPSNHPNHHPPLALAAVSLSLAQCIRFRNKYIFNFTRELLEDPIRLSVTRGFKSRLWGPAVGPWCPTACWILNSTETRTSSLPLISKSLNLVKVLSSLRLQETLKATAETALRRK